MHTHTDRERKQTKIATDIENRKADKQKVKKEGKDMKRKRRFGSIQRDSNPYIGV